MNVSDIAEVAHEVNAAYCRAIGDDSQPTWADAPDWQKDSAVNGVMMHMENPAAGPSGSHAAWLKEKLADGWVHGLVKDPDKKTHPCVMPFGDLPSWQRVKDFLFCQVVHSLARFVEPVGALEGLERAPDDVAGSALGVQKNAPFDPSATGLENAEPPKPPESSFQDGTDSEDDEHGIPIHPSGRALAPLTGGEPGAPLNQALNEEPSLASQDAHDFPGGE